ncbi:hypothetical protein M8J77_005277 [Diaphorina citri]|nr:hypothetical protein M8J77_005277 [Diaphorina citri]
MKSPCALESTYSACPSNPVYNILFPTSVRRRLGIYEFTRTPKPLFVRFRAIEAYVQELDRCDMMEYKDLTPPWSDDSEDLPEINTDLAKMKKIDTPDHVYKSNFTALINTNYPDYTLCFTDGSKTENRTSCAFSIDGRIQSCSLNQFNSIFSAEIIALLLSLKNLLGTTHSKIAIISDSLSALKSLSNCKNTNPLVSQVIDLWRNLTSNNIKLTFIWCPSHCGIEGNEEVDRAANRDGQTQAINICSPDDLKTMVKKLAYNNWQVLWNQTDPLNKLKQIKPIISTWKTSQQSRRYDEVVLSRLRIGHTRVTHSYLFERTTPPLCSCGENLTVKHLLDCVRNAPVRSTLSSKPSLLDEPEGVKAVLEYLKLIGLYTKI